MLTMLLLIILLPLKAYAQEGSATNNSAYLIGTGDYNRTSYAIGGSICYLFKNIAEVRTRGCKALPGTSLQNIYDLDESGVNFAILEADWQEQGYTGSSEEDFPDGPREELRRVFGLHEEVVMVLVRDDSFFQVFEDLKNKKLQLGPNGTAARETFELLLKQKNWSMDDFAITTEQNILKQIKALCAGEVDAIPFVTSFANASIVNALNECSLRSIPFSKELIGELVGKYGFYSYTILASEMDKVLKGHTGVLTVGSGLITYADMDERIVYKLVKTVFENLDQLKKMHPALAGLGRQYMLREDVSLPFHPGALRYYKEQSWK
ncbi:TAXI family TRAP transporter solute-binding subunit [Rhodospirillaceae bacterium RKSG073]|nr:TAXI family TRAP transporter solute-binding subunit [Curvivirga aplysinae]